MALHRSSLTNETAALNLLEPSNAASLAEIAAYIEDVGDRLSLQDYLAAPFDMNNNQDKAVFEALTHDKSGF